MVKKKRPAVLFWTNGATWFGVVGDETVAEIPVTARNRNNPPASFKAVVREYAREHADRKKLSRVI